jgi:hypothetical protein
MINHPPRTLQEAGITVNTAGHYFLPPVIIQYGNGHHQSLIIEVGTSITTQPSTSASLAGVAQMLRNSSFPNFAGPNIPASGPSAESTANQPDESRVESRVESRSESRPETRPEISTEGNTEINTEGNTERNRSRSTSRVRPVEDQTNQQNQQIAPSSELSAASTPTGVRGLDYPAFDVSTNGIYNDPTQPTSNLLAPIQRAFDRIYRQPRGNNNNNNNDSNNVDNNSNDNINNNSTDANTNNSNDSNNNNTNNLSSNGVESRNIILTVNYVYGGINNESNDGSLLLYVPNIDETDEENVNVIVRLATEIALRTIATTLRKSSGVSNETFENLTVKKVKDLNENQQECSICYESYVDKDEDDANTLDNNNKRKREDDFDEENDTSKRIKSNTGESVSANSILKSETNSVLKHYPVVMKCGHIFGASCLKEWFKANSSCPLCRERIPNVMETESGDSRYITITLPNLANIISNSRSLIENFNNRHMTFNVSEDVITDTINPENSENMIPLLSTNSANILDRLEDIRRIQARNPNDNNSNNNESGNANNFNTANNDSTGTNNSTPVQRQTLLSFIRDVISSLSTRQNNPSAIITSHIPIRQRRVARTMPQFPGLFPPLGVESRRTANGVETREISMFDNDSNNDNNNTNDNDNNNSNNTAVNENTNSGDTNLDTAEERPHSQEQH